MSVALRKAVLLGNSSLLSSILDDIAEGVYIVSPRRQILFWNRGAERITGLSAQEVANRWCGDNLLNHVDEDGNLLCTGRCPLSYVFETGRSHQSRMYARHKDGHRIAIVAHASPVLDEEGRIIAAVEVFRDASEEEAQRKYQEKFQRVLAQYVSPATMDEVLAQLDQRPLPRSTVRDLTVLMLDLPAATQEQLPPDELTRMLESVCAMCEVIMIRYHGAIEHLAPGSMMASFINANDAVDAGLKIHAALDRYNRQGCRRHPVPAVVRIGISSGRVMEGQAGTRENPHVSTLAKVMQAAAQVRDAVGGGELWVSETTLSRLQDRSRFAVVEDKSHLAQEAPVIKFRYSMADC
jgi:PAS domain S-box-containing protein